MADDPASQDARACAVCGRVLERIFDRTGNETYAYQHSIADRESGAADHPAVPVRYSEAGHQIQLRCDFCFVDEVTHTLVTSKEIEAPAINVVYDTEWAMCSTCTGFVMADDWLGLRRHAFPAFERQHGPMHPATATEMRVVYRDIRESLLFIYQEQV